MNTGNGGLANLSSTRLRDFEKENLKQSEWSLKSYVPE